MVMGVNINSYYREKKEIEAYISTFSYIMKLLDISDQFEHVDIPEVEQYVQEIIRAKKQFGKFKKGSSLVVSGRHMGASVTESIMDYFRMLFHVDLIKFNSMLEEFQKNLDAIECMMENLGLLDSMIAIASYRESLSYYSVPELVKQEKAFLNITAFQRHPVWAAVCLAACCLAESVHLSEASEHFWSWRLE